MDCGLPRQDATWPHDNGCALVGLGMLAFMFWGVYRVLKALGSMHPIPCEGGMALGNTSNFLVKAEGDAVITTPPGTYTIYAVDTKSGELQLQEKGRRSNGSLTLRGKGGKQVLWLMK